MATYNKFNSFVLALAEKAHNLSSDQLVVALLTSANAPTATDAVLGDLVEIPYTNLNSRNITTTSSSQSSGVYKLVLQDLLLKASGGSVGPFREIVIYNDTAVNDELIAWTDFGSDLTIQDGDGLYIDFSDVAGLFTLS